MTYEPIELEKEILEFWEKNNIYKKVKKQREKGKRFSFFDGPPTANNPMGVHHSWGRTYKDLICRFKRMQGYNVRDQPGFDCQGLWVEVEVEKALNFQTKKDIENFGLANFSEKCKSRVLRFVDVWIDLSKKLGMWMDWENPYLTMSDNNIEHVWHFLKICYEKGWLFKGEKVLPWCPRCGTSLSSLEVSSGYKELTHTSVFLKFPIKGRHEEYLLVWTTTPWTLPANTAVAVHPDKTYVRIKQDTRIYYLLENLLKVVKGNYKIVERIKGKELEGLEYEAPYENIPAQKNVSHRVVLWKEVSEEEGTGLVHIAPGCGPEDYSLAKKLNLSILSPLDGDGKYIKGYDWLTKKFAIDVNDDILNDLMQRGFVYKTEAYTHRYPCCWRCGTELVYRTSEEWFISSEEIRPNLIKAAKTVKWSPKFGEKRMIDWLKNMGDWCISRKRYWGLPLPIWMCKKGHIQIIGSLEELKKKAISGMDQLKELHRPWIDKVILKCPECGREMYRIKDVGDCWLDAGIVPFSTLNYLHDKEYWKKWYPADYITEMHEQIKLWFYSMLFMSVTLKGIAPYKSALTHGPVLDETGREMHKSWGNAISAEEGLANIGADIMRWMYVSQNPKLPLCFGYTPAKEVRKKLNVLYNTGRYVQTYCEANNYRPKDIKELDLASKWIFSKLETLKDIVTKSLENLEPHIAAREIENFFLEDFSRWYIHLIRDKVKIGYTGKDKEKVLFTLYNVMFDLLKIIAPFMPFISEDLYQEFFRKYEKKESIHMFDYPVSDKKKIDKKLEQEMEIVRKITEISNFLKQREDIKLKWPVKSILIKNNTKLKKLSDTQKNLLKDICNTREIKLVSKKPKGNFGEIDFYYGKLYLDLSEDEKLFEQRLYRELTRKIQALRKKYDFVVSDKIDLTLKSDAKTEKVLKKFTSLKKDVNAKTLEIGKLKGINKGELKFRDIVIEIGF
ncbi:MAG: isoleucine--tRNA ligase [Candidatus Aenigmarchaeota archaeon]|nr:isoleucine--tRNA ligase [Candidatus Aenigmarchaeota archaeon]